MSRQALFFSKAFVWTGSTLSSSETKAICFLLGRVNKLGEMLAHTNSDVDSLNPTSDV